MQNFSTAAQFQGQYLSESLFDHIADIVHFAKDAKGRYTMVNMTLVKRLGFKEKSQLIGKMATELFPSPLGEEFSAQDLEIIQTGVGIYGRLELHLYPNQKQGWTLTYKEPIMNQDGKVVGICGLSRDIHDLSKQRDDLEAVNQVIEHIKANIDTNLLIPNLAEMAKLSVYQLDQKIKQLYSVTMGQFIIQVRVEKACHLLRCSKKEIVDLALDCGYSDQSSFTRQFKQITGVTPGAYRKQFS